MATNRGQRSGVNNLGIPEDVAADIEEFCSNIATAMIEERKKVEPIWQDISDYLLPQFSDWNFNTQADLTAGEKIYDGSAITAHARQSSGIFGWLVSPMIPWLELIPKDKKLRNNKVVMEYLNQVVEHLYEVFSQSNFYDAIAEDISICSGIGTSVMTIEENEELGVPVYTPLHPREFYIAENEYGYCDTLMRRYELTHRQFIASFGKIFDEKQTEEIMKSPGRRVMIRQFVYPNKDYVESDTPKLGLNKKFKSIYISESAPTPTGTSSKILKAGGMDEQRFLAWRFEHITGLAYGSCSAIKAIYDIKTINLQNKTMLDAQQLAAKPPIQTSELMKGKLRIVPGGVTYGFDEIKPVFTGSQQYPISVDAIARRDKIINEHFKTEFFQSISQLQSGARDRTATEIMEIKAESAAVMGSTVGRINAERLEPLIRLTLLIEREAKRLPEVPAGVPGDVIFYVNFIGPLFQAQRKYLKVQGIQQGISSAVSLAQVNPDLLLNFDLNYAVREMAIASGYPYAGLRTDEEVKKLQDQAAQARAQAAQAQAENERLSSMARGSRAIEPGSPSALLKNGE